MATKITLTYTLEDTQLNLVAKGLGYTDTTTEINPETQEWRQVPNQQTPTEYIINQFTTMIESRVKPLFLAELEAGIQAQRSAAIEQVSAAIDSAREVITESV